MQVAANYRDLSVTHLSSRLDSVDTRHNNNHAKAPQRIGQVDSHHRWDAETGIFTSKCSLSSVNTRVCVFRETISQLGDTVEEVGRLQGKVRQSLKELKIFLNGMGTVASNAVKELNTLKFD